MSILKEIILNFSQAIKTRFASVLDSREALLAAVTLPKFKMRWLREETRRKALRTLLITECCASAVAATHTEEQVVRPLELSPASSSSEDDFLCLRESRNQDLLILTGR